MITEWLRQQKILTPQEIAQAEEEFRSLPINQKEELWQALHEYFSKASLATDRRLWFSYFRWYVDLTWKLFPEMTEEVITSVAFPRQLIMAIVLGYEPVNELLNFLNNHPYNEETMPATYGKIRDGVLRSGAIVGVIKGREVTYAEIIRELTVITQSNDTLRLAEFTSRLKEVLFPKTDEELVARYFDDEQDEAVSECMSALSFFMGIDPSAIWAMVQTAFHPEYFDIQPPVTPAPVAVNTVPSPTPSARVKNEVSQPQPPRRPSVPNTVLSSPVVSPAQNFSAPVQPPPVVAPPLSRNSVPGGNSAPTQSRDASLPIVSTSERPTTPGRPSNKEVRNMVEALFPPQEGSEEERLPKILNLLETLSVRYGDDSIRDVYFFNSERGRFEWLA